jgi:2-hydroxy-3-keto-5-methylthiopentenyl-1-phosphate phosphatase
MLNNLNNSLTIFCDFDGTITAQDTIDKLLHLYANDEWMAVEKLWQEEKIGSKECLERQIECIEQITKKEIDSFIDDIKIDPYFVKFFQRIKKSNIPFYIVSDGFNLFINKILKNNKIYDVPVYCNSLLLTDNALVPSFPHHDITCSSGSGMCKCNIVTGLSNGNKIIYIGDGKSDACAVKHADVVFAKNSLIKRCQLNNIKYFEFNSFKDIEKAIFFNPAEILYNYNRLPLPRDLEKIESMLMGRNLDPA